MKKSTKNDSISTRIKRVATKKKHQERAKELYLVIDISTKKRKYSYQKIVEILYKEYNVEYHRSLVDKWNRKYGWKDLLVKKLITLQDRVVKEKTDIIPEQITQEQVDDHEINEIAKVISAKKNLRNTFLIYMQNRVMGRKKAVINNQEIKIDMNDIDIKGYFKVLDDSLKAYEDVPQTEKIEITLPDLMKKNKGYDN